MLAARRRDLVADRTRVINRLHDQLPASSPLWNAPWTSPTPGPLILLTGYQTPAAIRRIGAGGWRPGCATARSAAPPRSPPRPSRRRRAPAHHRARRAAGRAAGAHARQGGDDPQRADHRDRQAHRGPVSPPRTRRGDRQHARHRHPARRGVPRRHRRRHGRASPPPTASPASPASRPAPRDSGRISGNLHRPRRYHRGLQRVFYTSALISIRCYHESRRFYDRKRAEGKRHTQAVLALARRRVNVLWALLRDQRCYQLTPPQATAA